jgi:hypothetical protein
MLKGLLVKGQVLNVISMMIDTDRFDCILQRRVKIVPIYMFFNSVLYPKIIISHLI